MDITNSLNYFVRKDLGGHLKNDCLNRYSECEYCNVKGKYTDLVVHDKVCGKKILPCPDIACSKTRPREEMDDHISKECLFAVIPCKFKNLGCNRAMRRKDMVVHEQNNEFHFLMALNTVAELNNTVSELKKTVVELKGTVADTVVKIQSENEWQAGQQEEKRVGPITFTLSDYHAKKSSDEKFTSFPFYTSPAGYRMAIRVFANGDGEGRDTHVSVCAPILEGKFDNDLQWPFTGSI